jgi:hypothetical protein
MLCWWKQKVVSSYVKWMKEKYMIEEWLIDRTVKVILLVVVRNGVATARIGTSGRVGDETALENGGRIDWLLPLKMLFLPATRLREQQRVLGGTGTTDLDLFIGTGRSIIRE